MTLTPPSMSQFASKDDLAVDVLARTLWGEARGEGEAGMIAVACGAGLAGRVK